MAQSAEMLQELANNLIQEAEQKGAHLRLLGGLAFYIHSLPARSQPALRRDYQDLDFAVDTRGAKFVPKVFANQGWTEDRQFNALHGRTPIFSSGALNNATPWSWMATWIPIHSRFPWPTCF